MSFAAAPPSRRVVCVGDIMTDVVAHLPGPLALGSDTPASVRLTGGGSAANTACWLAACGIDVSLVGRVGDDAAGRAAIDELRQHGVDCVVGTDPDLPTGTCLVLVDPSGERTMVPDAGANVALSTVDVGPADHLHVSAYALFHAGARSAVLAAMQSAGSVSVDVASTAMLLEQGAAAVRAWCAGMTVFANAEEAQVLTGRTDPTAAAVSLAQWGGVGIVKCGAAGAVYAQADSVVHVPVPAIVAAVDTTGAGDAFAAGYLAARLAGRTVVECVGYGHELAARAVMMVGGRPPVLRL